MADAAVEFLLGNLKDLLSYHAHLITGTRKSIEDLEIDLRLFNSYLQESQQRRRKDGPTRVLVQNIRDVVYEVEDVLDAFVTQALENKASTFGKFWTPALKLHTIGKKLEDVKRKVERARTNYADRRDRDQDKYEKPEVRPPRLTDVVGFADVTEELIQRLTKETDYFDVVCLVGMFGLGKTTLAWKIFNDSVIFYKYPVRIWLSISQEFSDKDIFISMLEKFTTINDEIRRKDKRAIALMVASYLENGSFLIVFDDVWTPGDWDRLRDALPTKNNKGKILITSRMTNVGQYACTPRPPNNLRFFTEEESWELLRLEALRTLDCPSELEATGRVIAKECEGLPLAVVIIGGILATKYWGSDLSTTLKAWRKVSAKVNSYLKEDTKDRMNSFISLSYEKLPYHLRACFLYLGLFPEDYEIPASKLILMWIGEGFIQKSNDASLEETGEKYLEDLINRNLVRIEKFTSDGKIKTCRIHDALRDFCRTEAGSVDENFLHEIKFVDNAFKPPIPEIEKYRRLCVHSHCSKFISAEPFGPCVRSFISIPKDEFPLSPENVPNILKAFKLLRVFDAKLLRFPKLTRELFQLVHVRYISMSFKLPTLTSKFSELWNLQTLIVDTTCGKLDVKADLLKLTQLRVFKTNASATLPKPSKDSKYGTELQTLGTISVESCTDEFFQKACNLKKLGIRGPLASLLSGKKGSLASLGEMKLLENLKLINDIYPLPASEGQLNRLPEHYHFPSTLKCLTIRGTSLDWSHMSTLGLLKKLEVLKLKGKAFMGKTWEAEEGGFRVLEFLLIDDTDLVAWTASSSHFPKLRGLVLRHCTNLTHVPIGLADIPTFKTLDLKTCELAAASARKIQDAKKKAQADFKLTVFPPIEQS